MTNAKSHCAGSVVDYSVGPETEMDENTDVYHTLRLSVCSDRRRAVLLSLNEGKKSLADLQ
ncbi:MAG: hypothetical protein ACXW1F_07665, partial [Halobacteriota archaeon]